MAEALIEMYLAGVSVRQVEDITEALWGTRVSPSTVSNLNRKIYATIEAWRKSKRAAELVEEYVGETLTYYAFPDSHWIKLKTNNPLERLMREIRRWTKIVGAFPDGQSCLNLAAARLRHIAGTQGSMRRYMNMAPLRELELQTTRAAVARQKMRKILDATARDAPSSAAASASIRRATRASCSTIARRRSCSEGMSVRRGTAAAIGVSILLQIPNPLPHYFTSKVNQYFAGLV